MLLYGGFPVNLTTDTGMSPLYIAASLNNQEIAYEILSFLKDSKMSRDKRKAIISEINKETNLSPLALSIIMDNSELAVSLIEAGAKTYYDGSRTQKNLSPIFLVCEKEDIDLLEVMCDCGASLYVKNSM
jgi:ankyrin repeat protein